MPFSIITYRIPVKVTALTLYYNLLPETVTVKLTRPGSRTTRH